MSAYVIFNYNITDRERIDQLAEMVSPVDELYGAEVIVGSPVKALEGSTNTHMVIYEFESFAAAEKWYYSEEHQKISKFRNEITSGWVAILPGNSETEELVKSGYFDCIK